MASWTEMICEGIAKEFQGFPCNHYKAKESRCWLLQERQAVSFAFDSSCYEELPDGILERLRLLEKKIFPQQEELLDAIAHLIGKNAITDHKAVIERSIQRWPELMLQECRALDIFPK